MAVRMADSASRRPRSAARRWLPRAAVAALLVGAAVLSSSPFLPYSDDELHETAFVGSKASSVDSRRLRDESPIAMEGRSRRANIHKMPKKNANRWLERRQQVALFKIPMKFQKLLYRQDPILDYWSQTLKLSFVEGEDDVVTQEEVMDYFTTDEYKPEAVITGHQLPHEKVRHTYVHFRTNADCKKARYEKDGGPIGKASEVKLVFCPEKKWIRLRDGVSLSGPKDRAFYMKAYGMETYSGYADDWAPHTGTRDNPVYPEN
eukprot:TRINITY_DN68640_c0_g1_i1.p1 TRINITY_DN68640_c0_g1~~TRINITY_DN68640_c0_g1_i1.p1  ORF type:complete len:289 (+),score=51.29 TRINITY_DN68640_c0_g1_i1:83-868(+)